MIEGLRVWLARRLAPKGYEVRIAPIKIGSESSVGRWMGQYSHAMRCGKSQYMASSVLAAVKAGRSFSGYDPKGGIEFPADWAPPTAESNALTNEMLADIISGRERQRFVLKSEFDSAKAALDRIDNHAQRLGNQIKRIRAVVDADDGRTTESKYLEIAAIAHEVIARGR